MDRPASGIAIGIAAPDRVPRRFPADRAANSGIFCRTERGDRRITSKLRDLDMLLAKSYSAA
jgi:hypothetical protein